MYSLKFFITSIVSGLLILVLVFLTRQLNLHLLRSKARSRHSSSHLSNGVTVLVCRNSDGECEQVSTSLNEMGMKRVFGVVFNVAGAALRSRPERLSFLVLMISGEHMEQVLNGVVEVIFKVQACDFHTLLV